MSAHPSLSDWTDEQRFSELVAQHRSGFAAGARPSDVMPLDVSQFPPSAAFGDECAAEGAATVVSYDGGRTAEQIRAESERDPWLWRLMPAAIAVGALSAAWWQFGGGL